MFTEDDNFDLLQHVIEHVEGIFPNFHIVSSIGLPIVNFKLGTSDTVYQLYITSDGTLQYCQLGSCKEDATYCSYVSEIVDYLHNISRTPPLSTCTLS